MALFLRRTKWTVALSFSSFSSVAALLPPTLLVGARGLRSDAALEAISKAREEKVTNLVLYNYPSLSGAFSALFAHLFHFHLHLPCLILPCSSVIPFSVRDLWLEGLERCYFLDFLGPRGFADVLSRQLDCEIAGFDHRKSVLSRVEEECTEKVKFYVDVEKSSSKAVYEYFSTKLGDMESSDGETATLLNPEEQDHVGTVLKYIEDSDLRRWSLPERKAFSIGIGEWRSRINCVTNPYMFKELLDMNAADLIARGDSYIFTRQNAASKLLDRVFKVRLGRGLYGECLGVRADENANLIDEIGKQLSIRSAAAGLRPIGAVVYMQRNNLKMCLRSTDSTTDTSEVAKAYGGGGSLSSSSFIIRMDEYNQWLSGGASS